MRANPRQMTVRELISALSRKNPESSVTFGFDHCYPTGVGSYRGYYEDLAITFKQFQGCTVKQLLEMLQNAVGSTVEGYKGGEYLISDDTVVWAANYGTAPGMAIVDVVETPYQIWLKTELVD